MSNPRRITLRLPFSIHAKLVALADKEGVSLNQYIVLNLSNCLQCYSIEPHTGRDRAAQETRTDDLIYSRQCTRCGDVKRCNADALKATVFYCSLGCAD